METHAPIARIFSPMQLAGDTAPLPRDSQYEFWVEQILGHGARWNVERLNPAAGFRGRAHHARVGAILLAEHHNDPFRIWRGPARGGVDDGWVYLATSSVEAFAGERCEQPVAPGELVLVDSRQPIILNNSRFARVRYMMIPFAAIPRKQHPGDKPLGLRTIPRAQPLGRMLHAHFDGLFDLAWHPPNPPTETAGLAARQLLELLAAVCTAEPAESAPIPVSDIAAARYRDVLNLMRWHCAEPGLTPERIAARAGLSRASLYRLFQMHQTRFSDELVGLRLERARGLLAMPGREASLTEIALSAGFANSSVFSRRFRSAFGQTPSEYRRGLRGTLRLGDKSDTPRQAVSGINVYRRRQICLATRSKDAR